MTICWVSGSCRGLMVRFLDKPMLQRGLELMMKYADRPMDLADASLVVMAEHLKCRKVFTIDRGDFTTYRIRQGHRNQAFEIIS